MKILAYPLGPLETNCYLLYADKGGGAVLVDAPQEAAAFIPRELEKIGRSLEAILLTHGHWDHIWDAGELSAATGAKIYAGEGGRRLIEEEGFQSANAFSGFGLKPAKIDAVVKDGQQLGVAGLEILCLETPGHCPGSFSYYIGDAGGESPKRALFPGDLLFAGSIGRTDLWGGDFSLLEKSIREKVYSLPADTAVYPGHGESTSIGLEARSNPFVRA